MSQQRHRGPHSHDRSLFHEDRIESLRLALEEVSWLLSRKYARTAAIKVVGDRHNLVKRQRLALNRAACTDAQRIARKGSRVGTASLAGRNLAIDGFNCIITFEAMLSGGLVFVGRDDVRRDLSSVHGTYRQVDETVQAIHSVASVIREAASVTWLLDRPVSNSGRLAQRLRDIAADQGLLWIVEVVDNPDKDLVQMTDAVVASTDSWILDHSEAWVDLGEGISHDALWLVDFRI